MADIYTTRDVKALLKNKVVVFIGDSNVRALYKDLVWLFNQNSLINNNCLRRKLEQCFMGDKLEDSSALTKSRDFYEIRCFRDVGYIFKFYFVTRCYCNILINYLEDIKKGACSIPDVIIMNSCLWDITRWGPNGVNEYKDNMEMLMKRLNRCLPARTLFLWATALPISVRSIRGGLIIKQIEFMEKSLRFHLMEANLFARNLVNSYGFDVVDFHYHLQFQISRRSSDGVHFLPLPVRLQTNLYLTHIALSWGRNLPKRGDLMFMENEKALATNAEPNTQPNITPDQIPLPASREPPFNEQKIYVTLPMSSAQVNQNQQLTDNPINQAQSTSQSKSNQKKINEKKIHSRRWRQNRQKNEKIRRQNNDKVYNKRGKCQADAAQVNHNQQRTNNPNNQAQSTTQSKSNQNKNKMSDRYTKWRKNENIRRNNNDKIYNKRGDYRRADRFLRC